MVLITTSLDALDYAISFKEAGLEETYPASSLNRAGMDDRTPVDTILRANGTYIYITED